MISPLNCIQEIVGHDRHYPWRVLVTCTFLNQTHGRGVRPMIEEFFRIVPTPEAMAHVEKAAIDHLLRPLGFHNRRFVTLCKMTRDYLALRPFDQIYGVGPYALDSIHLFVDGSYGPLTSKDTWLRPYLEWRLAGGPAVEWDRLDHMIWREQQHGRIDNATQQQEA